ncbi:DUF3014 domain-containing protein [Aliidiomarina haloalkalitolerans]|uniref:DUF3014 domain-containing protein n=1 Tax=Aliidiomarina haloalkalitolerans TaxID=859059 RepID=A0A432VU42_9GAMM|nr:DUF3014 domain-containing protein [Aliidiomarina haloalkalitolerans]RUO19856.1 hypothetical protein CWE06_07410 [Aliidiomarina haloalkalitolerans]
MTEHHQSESEPTENKSLLSGKVIVGFIVALVIIVVALWFTRGGEPEPAPVEPQPIEQPVIAEPEPEPIPEPEVDVTSEPDPVVIPIPEEELEPVEQEPPLPALDEAGPVLVDEAMAAGLNTSPVDSENMVRKLVVLAESMAKGELVREAHVVAGPESRFMVQEIDHQLYIDERTYARFDELATWFYGLDTDALVRLYNRYEPVFEQAHDEIKQPGTRLRARLLDAIAILLDTPEPTGLLALKDDKVMYTFADPELEALLPAQKQLLRMGPDNRALVKTKLREIRQRLQQ